MATWYYRDTDGNTAAMERAIALVRQTPFPSLTQEEQARTVRALIVAGLAVLDVASTSPPKSANGITTLGVRSKADFADDTRWAFYQAILGTWFCMYVAQTGQTAAPGDPGAPPAPPSIVTTIDGAPAVAAPPITLTQGAGSMLIVEAVVAVIGIAAATLTIIHVVDKIGQVSVMNASTRADAEVAIAENANGIQTIKNHLDAEQKAGKTLPWSTPELDVLETLKRANSAYWARVRPDPGTTLPQAQPGEPGIVKTVKQSVDLALLIAGLIAAAYFLK